MIKSYRGLLASSSSPSLSQDTIPLHTTDGKTGYRIVKFEVMSNYPGTSSHVGIMKIYKVSQTTIDGIVDFSDNTLLAASFATALVATFTYHDVIIFDSEIFNQDIYVTSFDASGNDVPFNYYIELEQIKLTENEALVAIVKDLREEQ